MTTQLNIDPNHTAVLIMDYQNEIVGRGAEMPSLAGLTPDQAEGLLDRSVAVLDAARQAGIPVVHIVARFREGYPEISPRNKLFSGLMRAGRLLEGTEGAEIHPRVAPQPGDVVVAKRRVGAFATSDMESILKARDITTLVLLGIATSGVVLGTVGWATETDYEMVVLADCCGDRDEEVHRVLTEKIFPTRATVADSPDFLRAVGSG
jgi:nicotinamidase-related amidase